METRKDQTESCKDKGACPCGVDQMKTTDLADGEVHHVTELTKQDPECKHDWTTRLPQEANAVMKGQDYPGW